MNDRQPWIDHKFIFEIDRGWTYNIMSRIKDCEIRIVHHCASMDENKLSMQIGDKWSIKEHIGHLIDLEQLWMNRFIQFENLLPKLKAADMENKKTTNANHNDNTIRALLNEFGYERNKLIDTFNSLSERAYNHSSYHARLDAMMKPVDLLFFIAEHDNHHIASIIDLKNEIETAQIL